MHKLLSFCICRVEGIMPLAFEFRQDQTKHCFRETLQELAMQRGNGASLPVIKATGQTRPEITLVTATDMAWGEHLRRGLITEGIDSQVLS